MLTILFSNEYIFFFWRSFCEQKIGLASSNLLLNVIKLSNKEELKEVQKKKKKNTTTDKLCSNCSICNKKIVVKIDSEKVIICALFKRGRQI